MAEVEQLIGEFEMTYPDKGSVNGLGKHTEYFYSDYEIEYFKKFEMAKVLSKKNGTMTYFGKVRKETVSAFKRDGLKWKYVSSYSAEVLDDVTKVATEEPEEPTEVKQAEDETEGDETDMTYYKSIYEYTKDADLSYYEIADGMIRETPFVEEVKPAEDPDFVISSDAVEHEGKWYRKVNFWENEESWLLESALYETVYLVYTEERHGHYVTDGRVFETEEEAKASI